MANRFVVHDRLAAQVSLVYTRVMDSNQTEYALLTLLNMLHCGPSSLLYALTTCPIDPRSHACRLYASHVESLGSGLCGTARFSHSVDCGNMRAWTLPGFLKPYVMDSDRLADPL